MFDSVRLTPNVMPISGWIGRRREATPLDSPLHRMVGRRIRDVATFATAHIEKVVRIAQRIWQRRSPLYDVEPCLSVISVEF
jgi:hypothetical protein